MLPSVFSFSVAVWKDSGHEITSFLTIKKGEKQRSNNESEILKIIENKCKNF